MKCFFAQNLVTQSVKEGLPWEFVVTEQITAQIRADKTERQQWYSNPDTNHCFYSFIEGVNSNLRVSKENNPPYAIWGLSADYDTLGLSKDRVMEAVRKMKIPPTYIEQSLGSNWRLVWVFSRHVHTANYDFARLFLERAVRWLDLHILPSFDEKSFVTPTRLFCNGGSWEKVGELMPETDLQAFFFKCAQEFSKLQSTQADSDVPLDVIEAAIRAKYPSFDWPTKFEESSQGPTFWIPESTSPMSAIVKRNGVITFSAHATKMFYTWSDILGEEFITSWSNDAITKATQDVYSDGHGIWILKDGAYHCEDRHVAQNYLKVNCRLSAKEDKQTGLSQIDIALNHVYFQNRIGGAGPFVFQKPGIIMYQGERRLNTYKGKPMEPAAGSQQWGSQGNFPFLSSLFEHLFKFESEVPFWHILAWFKYYYYAARTWNPLPGQNIFISGAAGSGKTLVNREVFGKAVGGCIDASDFFLDKSPFNSYLFYTPHWALDDDTPSGSPGAIMRTASIMKKVAANQDMVSNAKFQQQCPIHWGGRVGTTFNLDSYSGRIMGPLDDGVREKMNLYRCNAILFSFPSRMEVQRLLGVELPCFLRYIEDVQIPDFILPDPRYGIRAYHDEILSDNAHQSQAIATFKEVLIEALASYFQLNADSQEWRGTVTQLVRALAADLNNSEILRTLRLERANQFLEQIQKEGLIKCECDSGKLKTRIWIFPRSAIMPDVPIIPTSSHADYSAVADATPNPFEKI